MIIRPNYNALDIAKMIMAFMVIGIHTKMNSVCSAAVPKLLDFLMSSAVPFYFITSGFLLQNKILRKKNTDDVLKTSFARYLRIYLIWIIIYLPISIICFYNNEHSFWHDLLVYLRGVIFIGETAFSCALWYLLALAVSIFIISILNHLNLSLSKIWIIGILLMAFGFYMKNNPNPENPIIRFICNINNLLFSYPPNRNGLYFGLAHVTTGMIIRFIYDRIRYGFLLGTLCLVFSYILFLLNCPFFCLLEGCGFFIIVISIPLADNKIYERIRKESMFVYLIHMYIIFLMISTLNPSIYKEGNYYYVWTLICIISLFLAILVNKARKYKTFNWINYLIE